MKKTFSLLLLFVLFTSASLNLPVEKDELRCRNEKYATAEEGTCLDPKAYRLLKTINSVDKNPYNNEFAKRLIDIIEPAVNKVIDTKVSHASYDVPVRIYYPYKKTVQNPTLKPPPGPN